MDIKKYQYQGKIIELKHYPSTRDYDAGYHWECFDEAGKSLCDSLKQYPCASIERALEDAKEEIDWLLDIDSEELPIPAGVEA